MKKVLLLVIGIDVSKDDFHVCSKVKFCSGHVIIKGMRSFSNTEKGFKELLVWAKKREKDNCKVRFVMEATGSYYEDMAYYLHSFGKQVFVELPNKVKYYAKSLNIKTKTDKVDSKTIAEIGIERILSEWVPMTPQFKMLRDLNRERLSFIKEINRAKNQLHAMKHSHEKHASVMNIKQSQLAFYNQTIKQIETEIKQIVNSDPELKEKIRKIETVKGLRSTTIVTVLCETNGFKLFNSIRQLVSYAGLDVEMKESGKFTGKSRISKKGNTRIRQALFMPGMSACMHNDKIKGLYERVCERNPKIKKKGIVAAMRKLLILIFVLWKKNEEYNTDYVWS